MGVFSPFVSAGQVLYGSVLVRKNTGAGAFATPTLTVGAELDGLMRISRVAEAWFYAQRDGADQRPVIVLPGQSHMQVIIVL
jgi:hypothetical protein